MNKKVILFVLLGVIVPIAIGIAGVWVAAFTIRIYGLGMFVVAPLVVAYMTGVLTHQILEKTYFHAALFAVMNLVLGALIIFLAGFEGALCLFMAAPIAFPVVILFALLGCETSIRLDAIRSNQSMVLMAVMLPVFMGFEEWVEWPHEKHVVTTTVEVNAPIQAVWDSVIAFSPIEEPPTGIFAWGIAYPLEARIEGEGVGAIRHCVFSTGTFVEPITAWDEPNRLAFDVVENPPPMNELSIWPDLEVPHLHDTFVSTRGQFVLSERDGVTVLEGTTWYEQALWPDGYWSSLSDAIIHQVHLRVLNHIRKQAEATVAAQ